MTTNTDLRCADCDAGVALDMQHDCAKAPPHPDREMRRRLADINERYVAAMKELKEPHAFARGRTINVVAMSPLRVEIDGHDHIVLDEKAARALHGALDEILETLDNFIAEGDELAGGTAWRTGAVGDDGAR